ncbi:MAG: glycerate kinase [Blastocatellia bacterium]
MKDLKEIAKRIYLRTIKCLDLEAVIREKIKLIDDVFRVGAEQINLSNFREVVLIGFGKASVRMGASIERILGNHIKRGILVTNRRPSIRVKSRVIVAGHPLPDAGSFKAGEEILKIIRSCGHDSLIIFLISGGGSSLVEAPLLERITGDDLRDFNRLLVNSGATIKEINVLRKHLSLIKGGRLGFLAKDSRCVALYLSDVNEGDLRSIASNPLLPDEVTREEFFELVDKYKLLDKLPASISRAIVEKQIPEVPGGWLAEDQARGHLLLLGNKDATEVAARLAREEGYLVRADFNHAEGHYKEVADDLIKRLREFRVESPQARLSVVSGGEVSCPVLGEGLGGRNQEFVLYSAAQLAISGFEKAAVLSCGTDGIDGNSFATGAVADPQMIWNAERQGLNVTQFFRANDSHSFFQHMGGVVVTGPTENNVRDIRIMLAQ